jgi:hypothetical protein
MSSIVLVGSDLALVEGLAQTLGAVGHQITMASTIVEAAVLASAAPPLIALVERDLAIAQMRRGAGAVRIPVAPGGSLILYRATDELPDPLPPTLRRVTLADLALPLERHRLIALVQSVESRARTTGRDRPPTPPESRPI